MSWAIRELVYPLEIFWLMSGSRRSLWKSISICTEISNRNNL